MGGAAHKQWVWDGLRTDIAQVPYNMVPHKMPSIGLVGGLARGWGTPSQFLLNCLL